MKASRMVGLLLACNASVALCAPTGKPDPSPLGAYGESSTYCGHEAPPRDAAAIPFIGCFVLDAGHRARGTLATHALEIAVDDAGHEAFALEGESIGTAVRSPASGTGSPFVLPGGDGYRLCSDRNGADCPVKVAVFSRNPDRSVLFMISECLPSTAYHICVTTQADWDFETAHRNVQH